MATTSPSWMHSDMHPGFMNHALRSHYHHMNVGSISVVTIIQDMLLTLHKMISGSATIVQDIRTKGDQTKWEINTGDGRPTIIMQYNHRVNFPYPSTTEGNYHPPQVINLDEEKTQETPSTSNPDNSLGVAEYPQVPEKSVGPPKPIQNAFSDITGMPPIVSGNGGSLDSFLHHHMRGNIGPPPIKLEAPDGYNHPLQRPDFQRVAMQLHACKYCHKTFLHKSRRDIHERIHTGERPFQCSYCDKSFTLKTNKECHERIHTGEKPFSCSYCGKSFAQLNNKRGHERIHTGEKPYACQFCNKTFTQSSNKTMHERNQHLNESSLLSLM